MGRTLAGLALWFALGLTAAAQTIVNPEPAPCQSIPAPDTLNGVLGVQPGCLLAADAARPTAVQRAYATTDSSGNWSVTFARTFSITPVVSAKPVVTSSSRGDCGIYAVSTTGVNGGCWTYSTTVVSILGASVNPISTAAAGISVMIVAAQPTQ